MLFLLHFANGGFTYSWMMNPLVVIVVAIIIAAEKLLPRPEITARVIGAATIFTGGFMIVTSFIF